MSGSAHRAVLTLGEWGAFVVFLKNIWPPQDILGAPRPPQASLPLPQGGWPFRVTKLAPYDEQWARRDAGAWGGTAV
jgi:hypothetical protein